MAIENIGTVSSITMATTAVLLISICDAFQFDTVENV